MQLPGADSVVLRHGDVGVKSANVRHNMERQLRANVAALLDDRGIDGTVEREWGRIIIRTGETSDPEPTTEAATEAATDAFGVVSASPARSIGSTREEIVNRLVEIAEETYHGGTFAVRARRNGDHPFTSTEIEREAGAAIWDAVEDRFEPEVDLDDPDHRFSLEIREDETFVFLESHDGPGGLPLGTQEPLLAMVSGGHDSPVAAWLAMRRGSPIIPLYIDFEEYGGADHRARAFEVIRTLSRYAPNQNMDVRVLSAGDVANELVESLTRTRMLSLRRYMFRAAEVVAREEGAIGIITGEAVGQKSSQTAANLAATDAVTDLPIHRPLFAWDKQEIIDRARELGTYEGSTIPAGCNRIAPSGPATRARLEDVIEAEPDDLLERAEEAARNVEVVSIDPVKPVDPAPVR